MATKLDELLISIDPRRTIEQTMAHADEALSSFPGPARIEHWDIFQECIASFLCHAETVILRLREPMHGHPEHYWSRGINHLHKMYGPNGEKAAFEMVRTGNEGGLYGVLKALAMEAAKDYDKNEILGRINEYWNNLSTDEKLDAPLEYLDKFGHLLPSELTEESAGRIRANFPIVLGQHPDLIRSLLRVGK